MSYYQDELDGLIDENGEWDCEGYIETQKEIQENEAQRKNARSNRKSKKVHIQKRRKSQ